MNLGIQFIIRTSFFYCNYPTQISGDSIVQPELSNTQAQLLNEFLPDDVCPLGAQLPTDALDQVYQAGSEENKSIKEVNLLEPPSKILSMNAGKSCDFFCRELRFSQ